MDPITIGALIAGGTALIGGAMKSGDQAVAQGQSMDMAMNQQALQLLMAKSGVTMRADDIMNAYNRTGLHPLALMGVQAPSYTPVNYVSSGDSGMGDAVMGAGQNIGRALMATKSVDERDTQYINAARAQSLQKGELELQLLASQIRRMNEVGPAMPSMVNPGMIPGQGNSPHPNTLGIIQDSFNTKKVPGQERVNIPEMGYMVTPRGGQIPVWSKEGQERTEDDPLNKMGFVFRNQLLPMFGYNTNPPGKAPPGHYWMYDLINGYRLRKYAPYTAYEGPIKFD